jgi:hypothetical protein
METTGELADLAHGRDLDIHMGATPHPPGVSFALYSPWLLHLEET